MLQFKDTRNTPTARSKTTLFWLVVLTRLVVSTNGRVAKENENLRASIESKTRSTSAIEIKTQLNQTQISRKPSAELFMDMTTNSLDQEGVAPTSNKFKTPTQEQRSLLTSPPFAVLSLRSQPLSRTPQTSTPPAQILSLSSSIGSTFTPRPWAIPPEIMLPTPPPTPMAPQPTFCPQSIGSLFGDFDCRNKVPPVPGNAPERNVITEYFIPYPLPPQRTPNPLPPQRTPMPLPPQRTPKPLPPQRTPKPLPTQRTPNPLPTQRTPNPLPPQRIPMPLPPQRTPRPLPTKRTPNPLLSQRTPMSLPTQRTPMPLPTQRTPNPLLPQRTPKPLPPQRTPKPLPPQRTPMSLPTQRIPIILKPQKTRCPSPLSSTPPPRSAPSNRTPYQQSLTPYSSPSTTPNKLSSQSKIQPATPNKPSSQSKGQPTTPNKPPSQSKGQPTTPNKPPSQSKGQPTTPNKPSSQSKIQPTTPNKPPSQSKGQPTTPNKPPSQSKGQPTTPNKPPSQSKGQPTTPNKPPSQSKGKPTTPNKPPSQSKGQPTTPNKPPSQSKGQPTTPNKPPPPSKGQPTTTNKSQGKRPSTTTNKPPPPSKHSSTAPNNIPKTPLSTTHMSLPIDMPYSSSISLLSGPLTSLPSSQNSPSITRTILTNLNSSSSKRTLSPDVTTTSTTKSRTPGIKYKVFDEYKNSSREVRCIKHSVYKDGECLFLHNNTHMKITATLIIRLQKEEENCNTVFNSFLVWLNALFIKHFSVPKLADIERISIGQHENNSLLYRAKVTIVVSPKADLKGYILTLISVFHDRNLSNENTVERTTSLHSFHCGFHFQTASNYLNHQRFELVKETKYIIQKNFKYFTYTFSKTIYCAMITLDKSEVFINDKFQMCLTYFNVCFDSLVYYQGKSIQVCMEDYFAELDRNLRKAERKDNWVYRYTPEGVLSLVLTSLSALCLITTLVIYCVCPELRTLPGKGNMFLSASLLFAQLTFQFGMTQNDFPLPCKIIGFFIHYFWLLSFSWMSACSIQMFLRFGRFTTGTAMSGSKTLLKYCFYAFGSPFLFISTNITYSLALSSGKEYGYGLDLCYISYPLMVFITFTVPAFLVTIKNIILFVIVCCRVGRHRTLPSASSHFSRSKVLVKLSCLTGCLWLAGFVNHWVKLDVLQYVFIVLNASQGVFIMASFVCTKRVLGMLQKRWNK